MDKRNYDDILHFTRPVSQKHPPMPIRDRAAQFSPFAALSGYEAAVQEKARLTEKKTELDEEAKSRLNEKLQILKEAEEMRPEVAPKQNFCISERICGKRAEPIGA